jgi:Tfp pilus assembly protein PilX
MKRVLINFQRSIEAVIGRVQRRFQRARSGTILIMVVALLVLLALMGTAFIATARLDRSATGEMRQLTSWQDIADGLAQQALNTASQWIVADSQTFTSHTVNTPDGTGAGSSYLAARDPVIYGPGNDTLMAGGASQFETQLKTLNPNMKTGTAIIAWPHITQPLGYSYFTSPIVPAILPSPAEVNGGTNTYDLGSLQYASVMGLTPPPPITMVTPYLMVPSNVVISYPIGYGGTGNGNTALAGRTWTFPAFYRLYQAPNSGSTTAAPSWMADGPFLAADATGWGIADAGLVQLNMPPTNGISWFAAWRIVDDAAAVNVNTAFTPILDRDANLNCQNYFPSDVDLLDLLSGNFNTASGQYSLGDGEWLNINARRYARYSDFSYFFPSNAYNYSSYAAIDDANVTHTDMQYSSDAEMIWTNLGRRLDYPAYFPSGSAAANPLNPSAPLVVQAGDPLNQYQRPFNESDTAALGYRGVMAQTDGPASKFEEIQANRSTSPPGNQYGDSIYGSAVNYMANTNNQFKFFEPNQVAYWYDWNFNYDFPYDWNGNPAHSSTNVPIFNGPSSVPILSQLTIGNSLGVVANNPNYSNYNYRNPRADLAATTRIMNQVRTVDPAVVAGVAVGDVITLLLPNTSINSAIPTLTSNLPHKACLNTALFGELWRASINVLNNFPSQDGTTASTGINATNGYYSSLNVPGGIFDPISGNVHCNPVQFRSPMRDPSPTLGSTVSTGTSCPLNASALAMPGQDVLALRAACMATNMITLRDQHGLSIPAVDQNGKTITDSNGNPVYDLLPRRSKQVITLKTPPPPPTPSGATQSAGCTSCNALIYGVGMQPCITEVYVSTDNTVHNDQPLNNGQNPEGLVVIKLYNPYPFALSIANYGIALVDRSGFSTSAMKVQLMDLSATALSPTAPMPITSIPKNSYLVLTNYTSGGYWPSYISATAPSTTNTANQTYVYVQNLTQLIGGMGASPAPLSGTNGYEMVLLAPVNPNPASNVPADLMPQAPVDSFDFSGLLETANASTFNAWHYMRVSGNKQEMSVVSNTMINPNWKCVYPGAYYGATTGTNTAPPSANNVGTASTVPAHYVCDTETWTTTNPEPWKTGLPITKMHLDPTASNDSPDSTYVNPFPGIQLCNIDFGGYNKYSSIVGSKSSFPYGGFARVGDAVQAPFIGSYVILPYTGTPVTVSWPPTTAQPVSVMEVNPVTVDTCFVDDGDTGSANTDDAQEQLGRCVPIVLNTKILATTVDDYSMSGYYSPSNYALSAAYEPSAGFQNILPALWRYHFALELFNQFTAVSNPESDYLPNMEPGSWAGTVAPYPVSNTTATKVAPGTPVANDPANANGSEDGVGVEGPINVNTASWRVLASLELIPHSQDQQGVLNEKLAQAIVHYRDVDDGVTRYSALQNTGGVLTQAPGALVLPPRGHGPFNSLLELSQVFDYWVTGPNTTTTTPNGRRIYTSVFQNAFGPTGSANPFPTDFSSEATRHTWGYYTPGPWQTNTGNLQGSLQNIDWVSQYLMVNRVSNLLTTRSDTFTVYVVVQGWRNVTTANSIAAAGTLPELVVQRRMAMTVDRTGIVHNSGTPKTVQLTTK